jgi:hypothetical protein
MVTDHCPAIRTRGAFFVVIFVDINTMNVFVESIAVKARPDSTGVRHLDTWLGNCRPFFGGSEPYTNVQRAFGVGDVMLKREICRMGGAAACDGAPSVIRLQMYVYM